MPAMIICVRQSSASNAFCKPSRCACCKEQSRPCGIVSHYFEAATLLRLNVTAEKLRGSDESGGCRRPAAAPQFDNAEMRRLRKPFPEFQLNEIPLPFGPRMNVWRNEDHVAS